MISAIKPRMQRYWRQQRMRALIKRIPLQKNDKVIDLGGLPQMWEMIDLELDITLLNLPGVFVAREKGQFKHKYRFVEADACAPLDFADNHFALVFSNSLIEHVGNQERQQTFAENVCRLAPNYWIQTPSIWFPIESHCHLPFWWFYPSSLKQWWIEQWQKQGKTFKWKQMSETRSLSLRRLKSLFPSSKVYTEYVAGFPKSYSMYKVVTKEQSYLREG